MISIRNLKKYYGNNLALDIPALDFRQGTICAIMGPNGSGKTTLLRLMNGLEKPSAGQIQNSVGRLDMVYCLQKPFMFSGTVKDNICYGLKARKQRIDNEALDEIIKTFDLNGITNRKAKSLSAGEIQRVSIARAVILRPKLLLLDEPAANVDPENINKIETAIMRLYKNKTTIIMATHIAEQAYRLSAHIIRLEYGRVVSLDM